MRIHLIAIGGAVMHNLALALQKNGHHVSGSDDEIYNPAKDRLDKNGLLPDRFGWHPDTITNDIDLVILGMHARADNPELAKSQLLGLKILSFPEFIFEHSKNKKRIVIAGSHGKTTTTSMVMHALQHTGFSFDYLVGAQLEGFDNMVSLSDAPIIVIEGDEYLSSPIDKRAKFLHYKPHIAIITGVAWDHINVFPTWEQYLNPFEQLIRNMDENGILIYFQPDETLERLVKSNARCTTIPYQGLPYEVKNSTFNVLRNKKPSLPLKIFGAHNMANLHAAKLALQALSITEEDFLAAMGSFEGAAKRLQTLYTSNSFTAWLDFAHAPSKVEATVKAVKALYPNRKLFACVELHTFSSLNKKFLPHYAGTLDPADNGCVFYSPHTVAMKRMEPIAIQEMAEAFKHKNLRVFTEKEELEKYLLMQDWNQKNLLFMTSGNFGGIDFKGLTEKLSRNDSSS